MSSTNKYPVSSHPPTFNVGDVVLTKRNSTTTRVWEISSVSADTCSLEATYHHGGDVIHIIADEHKQNLILLAEAGLFSSDKDKKSFCQIMHKIHPKDATNPNDDFLVLGLYGWERAKIKQARGGVISGISSCYTLDGSKHVCVSIN